ncbi:MAG: hypothetical protein EOP05_07245, partial [Proteobacteria bacterium]
MNSGLQANKFMKLNMKTAFVMTMFSMLSVMVTACGHQNSAISTSSNNPGVGATGTNIDIKNCQVGQVHNAQNGCMPRGQCQVNTGIAPNSTQCIAGTTVTEEMKFGTSAGTRHFGQLAVTNLTQAELLLQAAGICNSNLGYGATNYPTGNMMSNTRCAAWLQRGGFAIVKSFSGVAANINIQIGAGSTFPTDLVPVLPGVYGSAYTYTGNNFSGVNYVSFSQQARNTKYNNGNGMQIVGVSPNGQSVNLLMLIDNGDLGSDRVEAQLVYQGVEFAKIQLNR